MLLLLLCFNESFLKIRPGKVILRQVHEKSYLKKKQKQKHKKNRKFYEQKREKQRILLYHDLDKTVLTFRNCFKHACYYYKLLSHCYANNYCHLSLLNIKTKGCIFLFWNGLNFVS